MNKKHTVNGCSICQQGTLSPRLGPLGVRNHPEAQSRLCSAELEIIANNPHIDIFTPEVQKAAIKWGANDGHDHYGNYGFEVCMAPAGGEKFKEQALDFENAFKLDEVTVNAQCGGHVHIDARDFCIDDMCKLIMIYRYIEPGLYKMLPIYRRDLGQCMKLGDYYMDHGLDQVTGLKSAEKFKFNLDEGHGNHRGRGPCGLWHERHVGLNVSAWFQHGSVEWRHPPGLIKSIDICGWARLFTVIMEYAKQSKFIRIRARGLLPKVQPTIPAALEELNMMIEKLDPQLLDWAKQQQLHATQLWNAVRDRAL